MVTQYNLASALAHRSLGLVRNSWITIEDKPMCSTFNLIHNSNFQLSRKPLRRNRAEHFWMVVWEPKDHQQEFMAAQHPRGYTRRGHRDGLVETQHLHHWKMTIFQKKKKKKSQNTLADFQPNLTFVLLIRTLSIPLNWCANCRIWDITCHIWNEKSLTKQMLPYSRTLGRMQGLQRSYTELESTIYFCKNTRKQSKLPWDVPAAVGATTLSWASLQGTTELLAVVGEMQGDGHRFRTV